MYCIFAKESVDKMGGNRGKLASMAGHAYLHAYWNAEDKWGWDRYMDRYKYRIDEKATKITLIVDTVEQLKELEKSYTKTCGVSLVIDAAKTVFDEPTTVCLGIGPISSEKVKEDLSSLKVFI